MLLKKIFPLICLSLIGLGCPHSAVAQVASDNTLSTRVRSSDQRNFTIEEGDRSGNQLYHSFQEFSVPTNGSAIFNNAIDIENIITRVTGRLPSRIDGLIQAKGNANLFLINPSGIVFGANARLDIGGSFLGSTANSIRFADGTEFSATSSATPLLTVSTPVGLQYGAQPGAIQVVGVGNNLRLGVDFETIRDDRPTGLQVKPGQTLALIGGDLNLVGGNLTAAGGRIELGSVQSAGTVALNRSLNQWTFGYDDVSTFGRIRLAQAASADVSGNGAGTIQVRGRRLSLTEGSALLANTVGDGNGGGLNIRMTETVDVRGVAIVSGKPQFMSSLTSEVDSGASGQGGRILIDTDRLRLAEGGVISTAVFGAGQGGDIQVAARRIDVANGALGVALSDGSLADTPSGISADVNAMTAIGNGGNITLFAERLTVRDGANISASTLGAGNAGNLMIRADQVALLGGSTALGSSGLFNSVDAAEAIGSGGLLTLDADRLLITDGARISSGTSGEGNGGDISVTAREIDLVGASASNPSGILTTARSTAAGNGGNLRIRSTRLTVRDGAQISALTTGSGNAGNLRVNAADLELRGVGELGRSGLFASAIIGDGDGGNLSVVAERLSIEDGATINVSNFPSLNLEVPPGRGTVGNIKVRSSLVQLRQGGQVTTNSQSRQPGGNIAIDTQFLVAAGNSDITANAVNSFGGNVAITAQIIVGTRSRPMLTAESDITASSDLGAEFNGLVSLNTSEVDPSQGGVLLPDRFVDSSQMVVNACGEAEGNTFIVSGRGGIPENPRQVLRNRRAWQDLRVLEYGDDSLRVSRSAGALAPSPVATVREAQSWMTDASGQVSLVAGSLSRLGDRPLSCNPY
jgi:filamentous hemagglutinin family protein